MKAANAAPTAVPSNALITVLLLPWVLHVSVHLDLLWQEMDWIVLIWMSVRYMKPVVKPVKIHLEVIHVPAWMDTNWSMAPAMPQVLIQSCLSPPKIQSAAIT